MAVVTGPVRDRRTLWRGFGLGAIAAVVTIAALAALVNLAADDDGDTIRGSGVEVTDQRELAPFAAVELAGANTVIVDVGPAQAVAVTGDDNLVDNVSTAVRAALPVSSAFNPTVVPWPKRSIFAQNCAKLSP